MSHILYCAQLVSVCFMFHTESMFLPLNYIVYRCYSCFRQRRGHFFRHTCIQWLHSFSLYNALYTLVTLFLCFIRKYLSHIFSYDSSSCHTCIQWLQSFSLCNAFVYTCHTFSSESSENICPNKRSIFFSSSHLYTVVS